MKMNKLAKPYMMMAVVAIVFGVYASTSYGQETSATDDRIAPANPLPPTPYVNAGTGYKIGGKIVLIEPGGSIDGNIALGYQALLNMNTGPENTAVGVDALHSNMGGTDYPQGCCNTASGWYALSSNTTGNSNTATGNQALLSNTTGSFNTANGLGALTNNTTGSNNTISGYQALYFNNGSDNTASGFQALLENTTGSNNFADGYQALYNNTTGSNNVAIGYQAGINVGNNKSNNIEVGTTGSAGDNNLIRIGTNGTQTSADIAGIYGAGVGSTNSAVCIDNTGLLGTVNCTSAPSTRLVAGQQKAIERQQVQIETLQRQNEELQQRVARLEALIAKK
jgi:hypothetical protein